MGSNNPENQEIKRTLGSLDRLQEKLEELEKLRVSQDGINFFSATAMLTQEIKHSAFLAWLLNPDKEHNLGATTLQLFIERLFRYKIDQNKQTNIKSNQVILSGLDMNCLLEACKSGEIKVDTEISSSTGKRADICVTLQSNADKKDKYVILIENKVFSTTHDDQLREYEKLAKEKFSGYNQIFVYLSPKGEPPLNIDESYNDKWCIFDYVEIRNAIEKLIEKIRDKSLFPKLDSKSRSKLKLIMEDYIAMVNNNILIENLAVWDKIKEIRKEHAYELELINKWRDSSIEALRYCHKWVTEKFAGKIHFLPGKSLEEDACTFRFYTEEMKAVFDEADGNFGEDTRTPRCYVECTATYRSMQLLVQERGESWTSRLLKIIDAVADKKRLPKIETNKLLFQVRYLEEGDQAKPFNEEMKQHIDDCLHKFADRLATALNIIRELPL